MIPVRQSTAFETSIGPVLDADGVAFTGAVVGDFQVKKNGADWAALNGSATATHTAVGDYDLVLTASDLDTVGVAAIRINDTVNACATLYLQVIEEAVYDALYAASATGALPVSSGGIAASAFAAGAIDAAAIANGAIDAATFAADVDAEIRSYLGLASANLDTQLADVPTVSEFEARTPSATAIGNIEIVYNTDFATNYDTTNDRWTVNCKTWNNLTTVALPLVPTTAGRTLDVSAGGEAGIDWANVGSPTTTVALTNTSTASTGSVTNDVNGNLVGNVGGNVNGNVVGSVGSISGITFPTNFAALGISAGGVVNADAVAISNDTTAADNLERHYDGTGWGPLFIRTTIATLATQTSFTLTAGSADNSAYRHCMVIVTDQSTSTQKAFGFCSAYTGATKTVALEVDPGIFTMATGDIVEIVPTEAYYTWNSSNVDRTLSSTGNEAIVTAMLAADNGGTAVSTQLARVDAAVTSRASSSALTTAQNDLDILTGTDGVTLATSQPNYAPSTAAALASLVTTVGAAGAGLTEAGGTGDHLTAVVWNAAWDAEVQSEVIDALQETVPDSVPADGSRPNVQQAVRMILQALTEGAISSTTWTVKKEDGSTTLMTVTLDDASTPTSKTRAT